jgi:hypothetical protein
VLSKNLPTVTLPFVQCTSTPISAKVPHGFSLAHTYIVSRVLKVAEKAQDSSSDSMQHTNELRPQVEDAKICVVMVGLPARGKSYIAQKGISDPVADFESMSLLTCCGRH